MDILSDTESAPKIEIVAGNRGKYHGKMVANDNEMELYDVSSDVGKRSSGKEQQEAKKHLLKKKEESRI